MPRTRHRVPTLILIAVTVATACVEDEGGYCDGQADWNGEWAAYEDEVLEIVNQRRATGGSCGGEAIGPSEPLTANPELRCAARNHSTDMAIREYFSHETPEGESFVDRVTKADYAGFPQGENIAAGYPTPTAVMEGWMASPGHCANILEPSHTEIGIGYFGDTNHWTQVMGRQ